MDYEYAHGVAQVELAKAKQEIERLRQVADEVSARARRLEDVSCEQQNKIARLHGKIRFAADWLRGAGLTGQADEIMAALADGQCTREEK